jgi:hypothetical protein
MTSTTSLNNYILLKKTILNLDFFKNKYYFKECMCHYKQMKTKNVWARLQLLEARNGVHSNLVKYVVRSGMMI